MARRAKDITGFVKDLVAIEDLETKKRILRKILGIAYKNGIYPSNHLPVMVKLGFPFHDDSK